MATLAEIRTKVQRLVGDENQTVFVTAELNDYINEAIRQICVEVEHQITSSTAITTTDSDGMIALPADFLRLLELRYNGILLSQLPTERVRNAYSLVADGEPQGWIPFDYTRLQLWPRKASGTGLNILLRYVSYPATLSTDGNSPSLPTILHEAIVQYAVYRCFQKLNDMEMANYALGDYNRQIMQYRYLRDNPQRDFTASVVETEVVDYLVY